MITEIYKFEDAHGNLVTISRVGNDFELETYSRNSGNIVTVPLHEAQVLILVNALVEAVG